MKDSIMSVCFAYVTDERGYDLATLSALSLGLSQPRPCHIRIFCHKFMPKAGGRFQAAAERLGIRLSFAPIEDAAAEQHQTHGHVTTPTLLKLRAVENLVATFDRVVFLDNDVLVFEDLKIEAIDFGRHPIAAVADMDLSETGVLRHADPSEPAHVGGYFNAGFMIFDQANWGHAFLAAYEAALDAHDHGCTYKIDCTSIDQCALNTVFEDNWLELPARYNMQAGAKFTPSWKTASVRHYCGPRKYVPLSLFRSDLRDVRYLNTIHRLMGRPTSPFGAVYEAFNALNRVRNRRNSQPVRTLLRTLDARLDTRTAPRQARRARISAIAS